MERFILQTMTASGLAPTDEQQGVLDDLDAIVLIPPRNDVALDGIADYDGTAGFDPRPDFVKADDERMNHS